MNWLAASGIAGKIEKPIVLTSERDCTPNFEVTQGAKGKQASKITPL
jgi:hypothetical protein